MSVLDESENTENKEGYWRTVEIRGGDTMAQRKINFPIRSTPEKRPAESIYKQSSSGEAQNTRKTVEAAALKTSAAWTPPPRLCDASLL